MVSRFEVLDVPFLFLDRFGGPILLREQPTHRSDLTSFYRCLDTLYTTTIHFTRYVMASLLGMVPLRGYEIMVLVVCGMVVAAIFLCYVTWKLRYKIVLRVKTVGNVTFSHHMVTMLTMITLLQLNHGSSLDYFSFTDRTDGGSESSGTLGGG